MSTRQVVRCIGNRVFTVTLAKHATEAQLDISVYPTEVEACVTAQRRFIDGGVDPVSDYYIVKPKFSRKGLVCSHLRACGMSPYWLHTGHVLVRKDYISDSLIKHVDADYVFGYDALDDLDDHFKPRKLTAQNRG